MERRRHPRYQVSLEIEVRESATSFSSRGSTTDVSLGGCYVATIFPLAVGSKIEFTMWAGEDSVRGRGTVQTCHPGVGMGIQFLDLDSEARIKLERHLRSATPAESETASPFLR
jgi:PilZ domain